MSDAAGDRQFPGTPWSAHGWAIIGALPPTRQITLVSTSF